MKKACCAETESHGDDCIWRELYNENLGLKKERDALRAALELALEAAKSGQIDGDHHKMWVIDQMVRALTGDGYEKWVKDFNDGEDGPETYFWETGIAP